MRPPSKAAICSRLLLATRLRWAVRVARVARGPRVGVILVAAAFAGSVLRLGCVLVVLPLAVVVVGDDAGGTAGPHQPENQQPREES